MTGANDKGSLSVTTESRNIEGTFVDSEIRKA
jgi:hypothetical protein